MVEVNYKGHSNLADMIKGHINVWQSALEAQRDECALGVLLESNDFLYYEHELKALKDIQIAVEQLLK